MSPRSPRASPLPQVPSQPPAQPVSQWNLLGQSAQPVRRGGG
ncbi:hypothetical protein PMI17_04420, partial [Pantoea sp. GM01]